METSVTQLLKKTDNLFPNHIVYEFQPFIKTFNSKNVNSLEK